MTATMTAPSVFKSPAAERAIMAIYDDVLARWPVPYEPLHLDTRHGATFGLVCGPESGPPLVLLHGAGSNSMTWGADVTVYAQTYRVYAFDLLGEAGKSAPNRPPWDGPAYAEWLADLFDALDLERVTLVGLSQGGWTSLKFAVTYPERVDRLILLTPGGVVPVRASFMVKGIGYSFMGGWGTRRLVRMIFAGQPLPDGLEDILIVIMRGFKSRIGVLPNFTDEELKRLTMPVLMVGGDQDALFDTLKVADRLRKVLPDVQTTILPGMGHALIDTANIVTAFLAAHPV